MKKAIMLLFLAILSLTLVGCGAKDNQNGVGNKADLFPGFATVDMDGNPAADQIFAGHQLTLVNIWGTYCDPCKAELPALQQLYQEVKENDIAIVGIIVDGVDNNQAAQGLIEEHGITYLNLLPDDSLKKNLFPRLAGVPTSIFVNNKGEIVGDLVVGARTSKQFKEMIDNRLATQKDAAK